MSDNKNKLRTPIPQQRYLDVILNDPMLEVPAAWREIQVRDYCNWTRRYLLPIIKVLSVSLIWLIKIVKRILPIKLGSEKALNWLSTWFVRHCVSAETEEMLYRHLAVENSLIHFVVNNCGDESIKNYYLRPVSPEGLGDTEGMNATLLHDNIILNLFIDLGQSDSINLGPLEQLNFNGLEIPEFNNLRPRDKRAFNLDFESVLYITVLVLVLFLDDETMESSVNSLNLDYSLMRYLGLITGDSAFNAWTTGPFVNHMRTPFDLGQALQKHINLCEYAYTRLLSIRPQSKAR